MSRDTRVRKLQLIYRKPEGCDYCRAWGPSVAVLNDEAGRPERCPACGRSVPRRLTRRYLIRQGPQGRLPPGADPSDPAFVEWPETDER